MEEIYEKPTRRRSPSRERSTTNIYTDMSTGEGPLMATQVTYRDAVRQTLIEEIDRDDNVFLMGEDIGRYQGTFRVTKGLFHKYGLSARCRHADHRARLRRHRDRRGHDRPSAGCGDDDDVLLDPRARPDHQPRGQDPLHDEWPSKVPLVFRGPGGAAKQLSAQHSHSMEGWYAHCPV